MLVGSHEEIDGITQAAIHLQHNGLALAALQMLSATGIPLSYDLNKQMDRLGDRQRQVTVVRSIQ